MSTTAAPSIGVTMYQNTATGHVLCSSHHAAACGAVCVHTPFNTLSSDGCHVCELWDAIDRNLADSLGSMVAQFRNLCATRLSK